MLFRLSKTQWAVFFAFVSMFALGGSDNIRGPLFPELLRYFQLTNSQASLSFAVASFAMMIPPVNDGKESIAEDSLLWKISSYSRPVWDVN